MKRRRLAWQLFSPYAAVTFIALLVVAWYVSGSLRKFYLEQTEEDLKARVGLIRVQAADALRRADVHVLRALSARLGGASATRVTFILPDGVVAGDSMEDVSRMDNHASRPEIRQALQGRTGSQIRYSYTLQRSMMYVAEPVMDGTRVAGAVRGALAVTALEDTLEGIYLEIFTAWLIVSVLSALLSLWISRRISRPLVAMREGVDRFARGELERPLEIPPSIEIGALAEGMNRMATQLSDRIRIIEEQRREQGAVLSSMVEGVLAVDRNERILRLNDASSRLFGIDAAQATGRSIQEVIRNSELQSFVTQVLQSLDPVEGDIHLRKSDGVTCLQAQGTALRDSLGKEIGALIVLHDVTRLRRLETMRRDFVANVSHELKTPITAIRGSAETLLDGAIEEAAQAQRFLQIIARQSERLGSIVEDLLDLSRIEQESENSEVPVHSSSLRTVMKMPSSTASPALMCRSSPGRGMQRPELKSSIRAAASPPSTFPGSSSASTASITPDPANSAAPASASPSSSTSSRRREGRWR